MLKVGLGALVESDSAFKGIGKIVAIDNEKSSATIGFFKSPLQPYSNPIDVDIQYLTLVTSLDMRAEVFVQFPRSQTWKMGHYDGERPGNQALITFSREMRDPFDFTEIFIPNAYPNTEFNALDFLKGQGTSSPYLCNTLSQFYQAYYEQKRSCRSVSALISSSVELEKHQLAVVHEVLKDSEKKYLLCDEVGLGKTIEAGFIIRQHVLEKGRDSKVLILLPEALIEQWDFELTKRFHLGDLLNTNPDNDKPNIHICSFINALTYEDTPSMVVVDEAHQISSFPFNGKITEKLLFDSISDFTDQSDVTLLLTGTPMAGHPSAYFALLHLLNKNNFPLDEEAIETFSQTLPQQSRLREVYRLFKPENDNGLLDGALDDLEGFNLSDNILQGYIDELRPLVDIFADEVDKQKRDALIDFLAHHFSQKYLYDYRMLRNSRATGFEKSQSSEIELLFPGLNPAKLISWEAPDDGAYLDEHFEQYRSEAIFDEETFNALSLSDFKAWSEALLTSPLCFAGKVQKLLENTQLSETESVHWQQMLDQATGEQVLKNKALKETLLDWLTTNNEGKAVVFCGEKQTADNVFSYLLGSLDISVERHNKNETLEFNSNDAIRVLVCDEKGEDGLNLQGKKRLAIHYSMPILLSRLEQRNGRLNRYSALSTGVSPIDTFILTPNRDTFYRKWIEVLKEGVGCFVYYRANIQDEIDKKLEGEVWPSIRKMGYMALDSAIIELQKTIKEIYRSREIITKLATVDLDAEKAEQILAQMRQSDELFEASPALKNWITKGILFDMKKAGDDLYRFCYASGRTKMRSSMLLNKCIVGIDIQASSYDAPITRELSFSRKHCVENGSYPLRYGQPFVDAIADVSRGSPFGSSSAIIRQIPGQFEPKLFFIPQWLVEAQNTSIAEQIALDALTPPVVFSEVFGENGNIEQTPIIKTVVTARYNKSGTKVYHEEQGVPYKDTNITISGDEELIDIWQLVNGHIDKSRFNTALDLVHAQSKKVAVEAFKATSEAKEETPYKVTLLTIKYVLLFGGLS
ncbi:protein DpdE [Psychromonas sp. MB-3u-54]|uniref:protein DpdE n=1 Tax=Psychromonas sp. MB-3u-54 TaxID=2058319 RepID=UPI0012FEA998|nr:protein DpdE [Psychromonas sp. MB-3u-54]